MFSRVAIIHFKMVYNNSTENNVSLGTLENFLTSPQTNQISLKLECFCMNHTIAFVQICFTLTKTTQ